MSLHIKLSSGPLTRVQEIKKKSGLSLARSVQLLANVALSRADDLSFLYGETGKGKILVTLVRDREFTKEIERVSRAAGIPLSAVVDPLIRRALRHYGSEVKEAVREATLRKKRQRLTFRVATEVKSWLDVEAQQRAQSYSEILLACARSQAKTARSQIVNPDAKGPALISIYLSGKNLVDFEQQAHLLTLKPHQLVRGFLYNEMKKSQKRP
jgi:hypothetical protein